MFRGWTIAAKNKVSQNPYMGQLYSTELELEQWLITNEKCRQMVIIVLIKSACQF
jgi:hypothetical protein